MPLPRKLLVFLARSLILLAAALAAAALTYRLSMDRELAALQSTGLHRMDIYAASLEREIEKYAYFPATLALERDVTDLLTQTPEPRHVLRLNTYLERLNNRAGTLSIYVLNAQGKVLASSNWLRPDSFVGEDLSYRPYYHDAVAHGSGRFFGVGTTVGEAGYYLSAAINVDGKLVGIAVVKVGLEQLERSWSAAEAPVLVEDENGVVILSSVAAWKFTLMRPLDVAALQNFYRAYTYNRRPLPAFPGRLTQTLGEQTRLLNIPQGHGAQRSYLAQTRAFPRTAWRLSVLSPTGELERIARNQGALAFVLAALLASLGLIANERRRRQREQAAAREALQHAYAELECKVAERTADLSAVNARLHDEVEERTRAERVLREAQDGLVQAGKLAAIGQLATGIAHELNQPLAALSTLSGNTRRFLERGDLVTADANLARIHALVVQMGALTGQIKAFARKSSGEARPVDLGQAIDNALFLQEGRARKLSLRITRSLPEQPLYAWCDPNRLEQVLVNLFGNALDAMEQSPAPTLAISASAEAGTIRLSIADNGCGLADETQRNMFEPFFTTKAADKGLGLGLPISAGIVRDFGGTLIGANRPDGGAVFTLEIPAYANGAAG